ncbi:Aste57867_18058 [Aphanomyces stellatus]|uniref:Aste57867_18058 protein n=1 Tax=Aphanomyces stellatus TaxID=120398 RepID=A0A485LAH4_9STRA|nr:hypothetical protein As57867_017996 [Aphanomyces stellatus]VFT94797.1 Aste57867_18058 [Aphanomyces stellatus]
MNMPRCPRLFGAGLDEVHRWLEDRRKCEADPLAACQRYSVDPARHRESWVSSFADRAMLRTLMLLWDIPGDTEVLLDDVHEEKLLDIAGRLMNDVDPDVETLFNGVTMDMQRESVLYRVSRFMTDCEQRIKEAGASRSLEHITHLRKRCYVSIIERLPGLAQRTRARLKICEDQQHHWKIWGPRAALEARKDKQDKKRGHVEANLKEENKRLKHGDACDDSRGRGDERSRSRGRGRDRSFSAPRNESRNRWENRREDRGYSYDRGNEGGGYNQPRGYSRERFGQGAGKEEAFSVNGAATTQATKAERTRETGIPSSTLHSYYKQGAIAKYSSVMKPALTRRQQDLPS